MAKRTVSDKTLKDGAYQIALNPKYYGYQRGLAIMVNNFFDKKTGPGATSKARANVTEVLAQELHKPMIKDSKKGKSMPGLKIISGQQI